MRRVAFTLIELLVVITTIVLLMAIFAPGLQSSKMRVRTVLCGSNIKQLLLALAVYETENKTLPFSYNDSLIPPPGGYAGYIQYDRMGWWWFNYIAEYSRKDKGKRNVLQCPSKNLRNPKLKNNILCGNYGVNQSICKSSSGRKSWAKFIGKPLSTTDLPHPGQTLLIVDSGYSMINWWHAADTPPVSLGNIIIEDTAYIPGLKINEERLLWPGQERDAIEGRHPNKTVNVGFADGHTNRTKAATLLVEKTADGYKNRSPLWQPD